MKINKFRGISQETGKWVYGSLLIDYTGRYYIYPINALTFDEFIEVIPNTATQYTNINDINRK